MNRTRPHRSTSRIAGLLLALVASLVAVAPAQAAGDDSIGFGVTPLRFDAETGAGASSTHSITISNTNTSPTTFTFSKEDFEGDKEDPALTPVLLGGKFASDISGYDWITAPDAITIPPDQSRTVAVKVNVPSGATGAHYAALIVTGESRAAGELTAESRMGVLFLMNAGGAPPPDIVVTETTIVGPGKTVTKFINEGTTPVKNTKGTLTRDPKGPGKTTRITGKCTPYVMPKAGGKCVFKTPTTGKDPGYLPAGPVEEYVDVVGNPGDEETSARGELPTEWAGTWSSMLLPLVGVALFVLYFLFLRRRRKDEEEDGELAYSASSYS
ncbi:MAG: hypothetical protein JWL76_792 [Thermoleophilia bacterium]|nr:hypothetical protein [Thermoleophilia bacterium]